MNILDTRDLEKRRSELQDLQATLEAAKTAVTDGDSDLTPEAALAALGDARDEFGEAEAAELAELSALEAEIPEWYNGSALIPAGDFTDYAKELLEDVGDLPKDLPWYIAIDWDQTAKNLMADYSECEFQGETYLYRNC